MTEALELAAEYASGENLRTIRNLLEDENLDLTNRDHAHGVSVALRMASYSAPADVATELVASANEVVR